jgi:hypothetical protein
MHRQTDMYMRTLFAVDAGDFEVVAAARVIVAVALTHAQAHRYAHAEHSIVHERARQSGRQLGPEARPVT